MKIIVDKMPNEPKECIFSECTNQLRGNMYVIYTKEEGANLINVFF